MKIIDFHTHFYTGERTQDARDYLVREGYILNTPDGGLDGLKKFMKEDSVDFCVNLPVAAAPDAVKPINRRAIEYNAREKGIISFGAVHPGMEAVTDELDYISKNGIKGIKIHPQEQGFFPDDESMKSVYSFCENKGIVVIAHAGAGAEADFDKKTIKGTPERFRGVIDSYPALKLVVAHMGGLQMWKEAAKHLVGTRTYVDTAYCTIMDDGLLREMIYGFGADKTLFGTDFPWQRQNITFDKVKKAVKTENDLEMITNKNASALLGI